MGTFEGNARPAFFLPVNPAYSPCSFKMTPAAGFSLELSLEERYGMENNRSG
jgi:hypothetical protein